MGNRIFNISGDCKPGFHYMVDITSRLRAIKAMVDQGQYFTINRARQYGKTTVLRALNQYLQNDYYPVSMDFQTFGSGEFENEHIFSVSFARSFLRIMKRNCPVFLEVFGEAASQMKGAVKTEGDYFRLQRLFENLGDICTVSDKPIVLMIDEVDTASNNQVFIDFLSQLRACYIDRDIQPAFQSVILAGVYDVKNLKRKFRSEEDHRRNSPWNIAEEFKVDMSFSAKEIAGMLEDYEKDHQTGMDVVEMSQLIYEYTSGYPFLVSKLCKIIDEEIAQAKSFPNSEQAWTHAGLLEAVRVLTSEKNTLFESMVNKLYDFPELKEIVYSILFTGTGNPFNPLDPAIEAAEIFGFVKNAGGMIAVSNRIFEMVFYNLFLTSAENQNTDIYKSALRDKNQFIRAGHLNMELLLERFVTHFDDLYGDQPDQFKEEDGRRYFLLYLRPIINGTGNYYIESRTRNMERTDVIVDYRGEQFVIELKIWRGNAYNERGEKQLADYLDHYHLKKGYMVSYNFNQKKTIGVKRIVLGDKVLIEAVV